MLVELVVAVGVTHITKLEEGREVHRSITRMHTILSTTIGAGKQACIAIDNLQQVSSMNKLVNTFMVRTLTAQPLHASTLTAQPHYASTLTAATWFSRLCSLDSTARKG